MSLKTIHPTTQTNLNCIKLLPTNKRPVRRGKVTRYHVTLECRAKIFNYCLYPT